MKTLIIVGGLVVALVVGGATAYAYTGWEAGKQHLDKTSENIDKLSRRIQELKTEQNGKVNLKQFQIRGCFFILPMLL